MDLTTKYLGLTLKNPLIASASPFGFQLENIRALEASGAAAIVLPSIFEEQIEQEADDVERRIDAHTNSYAEALSHFPPAAAYHIRPHEYLEFIRRARRAVDVPVLASLNGITRAGWTNYARHVQDAGASAIELNVYFLPTDLSVSGAEVEQRYVDVLRAVKQAVSIPVAVKLGPYFSAVGHLVRRLDHAGADGFVLFSRFHGPDIDLGALRLRRDLDLSRKAEIRLPLLWIGVLAGQVRGSLAASTGVETADEVVKYLLVGADAVATTSALVRHGVGYMKTLLDGLTDWLARRDIDSVSRIRGRMRRRVMSDPIAFDRATYIRVLQHGMRYPAGVEGPPRSGGLAC